MKVETLLMLWHGKEPVFSVDFHPSGRLASSGADNDVKIWQVERKADGSVGVEYLCSLTRHTKSVNVVRFSPNGTTLASGGDDGFIFLWKKSTKANLITDADEKEVWTTLQTLRGKAQDIYDLAWAPDSTLLLAGSTDNSASIYHAKTGQCRHYFEHHSHYVQGVAWDPLGEFIASFSSDRTLRIYTRKKRKPTTKKTKDAQTEPKPETPSSSKRVIDKWDLVHIVNKREYAKVDEGKDKEDKKDKSETPKKEKEKESLQHKMFLDENVNTFFRRLTWSPEGSLLFVPTGLFKDTPTDNPVNTTYIFSRYTLTKPLLHIPSSKPVIAVRCNPILFKLWDSSSTKNETTTATTTSSEPSSQNPETNVFNLGYRIIYAIASTDCIAIYDTQRLHPISFISDLHYTNLTDLAWSADGQILVMSSTDGYCSVASFAPGELGILLPESEYPAAMKEAILLRTQVLEEETEPINVNNTENSESSSSSRSSTASTKPSDDNGPSATTAPSTNAPPTTPNSETPKQPEKKQRRIAPTLVSPLPN